LYRRAKNVEYASHIVREGCKMTIRTIVEVVIVVIVIYFAVRLFRKRG